MRAHRRLFILFLGLLMTLIGSEGFAQDAAYRNATLGMLGINKDEYVALVELSLKNPNTGAPAVYFVKCHNCPLEAGRTYTGKMHGSYVVWIEVNGAQVPVGNGALAPEPMSNLQAWDCAKRPAPDGGHWEWDSSAKLPRCEPGAKDPIKWKPEKGSKQEATRSNQRSNIPICDLQQPFHDTVLTVVITVTPESNLQWTFPEAPSHVAQRILTDLNANRRNITFKEASGVNPNLYINITVNETGAGTKQDTAYAIVTGLGKTGTLFSVNSGQAPFVGLSEAIDHLSSSMVTFFEGGWHKPSPCVAPNGEVLP